MSTSMPAPASEKRRPRWQKIAIVVAGALVALIVIGAIVGPKKTDTAPAAAGASSSSAAAVTTKSSATTEAAATTTTAEVTTEPTTDAPASYAADLASRPKPTAAQVRQIGLALVEIQPEMAEVKLSQIESWSDSMCGDIWTWVEGESGNLSLAQRAVRRFGGGNRPELTEAQGQQIVEAITTTYCHP